MDNKIEEKIQNAIAVIDSKIEEKTDYIDKMILRSKKVGLLGAIMVINGADIDTVLGLIVND